MFAGLLQALGGFMSFPVLFLAGAAAIASPIIIHLLNKRKFKILDWAAMDFLLEASKRNRRRVLLENLLLLLVRCLILVLLALLVAQPFIRPDGLSALGVDAVSVERIVLLDDSASMQVRTGAGNQTSLDTAKSALVQFVRDKARERSDDRFTLRLTSQPEIPRVVGERLREDNVEEIVRTIENVQPSDLPANLGAALTAVEQSLAESGPDANYAIYVVTDLRDTDWSPTTQTDVKKKPPAIVRRLGEQTTGVAILDVGSDEIDNLVIEDIQPLSKTLAQGVDAAFRVTVRNASDVRHDDVEVELSAADALPVKRTIESIGSHEVESVDFQFTFPQAGHVKLQATLSGADRLPADNQRFLAARVREGQRVLIVDGDPSSDPEKAESYFIAVAVAPEGEQLSGNLVDVVSENSFETTELEPYQAIILANVWRLSEERIAALEQWVSAGGGLVVSLGDQIDAELYNRLLYKEGQGLLPIKLASPIRGDETREESVNPVAKSTTHPVGSIYSGDLDIITQFIHVFRWYGSDSTDDDLKASDSTVLMTWNDKDNSPALVERAFGQGRVILVTTSLDRDWTDWAVDQTFLPFIQTLIGYIAQPTTGEGTAVVGTPLRQELDPAAYEEAAKMVIPGQEAAPLPIPVVPDTSGKVFVVQYDDTTSRGFYELQLSRRDGLPESVLFASNLDPAEGRLARVETGKLSEDIDLADKVKISAGMGALTLEDEGSWAELWKIVLFAVIGLLCVEQLMAWAFGRRR